MTQVKAPSTAVIEFTASCNLRCVFCPVGRGVIPRAGQTMTSPTFERIVQEIRDVVTYVYIGGYGEFLLHPRFAEWVRIIKAFAKINLATNLTVLPESALEALPLIDDLSVSISGGNRETYLAMHGMDCFDQVMDNLERLRRVRSSKIDITYVRTTVNDNVERARETLGEFEAKPLALPMRETMLPLLPKTGVTRFVIENGEIKTKAVVSKCREMWSVMYFLADGEMAFCCYDFANLGNLGNINRQTLDQIWNGEPYQKLRANHLAGQFHPVCQTQCSLP